jgi:DNA-binding transcriptional regulator YiaG
MPAVYAINRICPIMKNIYGVIILISIFTTAISLGISFINNISKNKKQFSKIGLLICSTAILFSKIENMPEMACQIFLNAKNALMDEMKSSIRKFLALTKMTRDEFADLCGVSKSQVDKWLSTVPIPRARQRLIIRIMKEEYAKQARLAQTKNPNSIHVPVTPQKYEKFRNEAERHGLTVPEWASEALDALSSIKSRS